MSFQHEDLDISKDQNFFNEAKVVVINEEGKKPAVVDLMSKLKLSMSESKQTNPVFRFAKIKYTNSSKIVNLFECNEVWRVVNLLYNF